MKWKLLFTQIEEEIQFTEKEKDLDNMLYFLNRIERYLSHDVAKDLDKLIKTSDLLHKIGLKQLVLIKEERQKLQ